MVSFYSFSYAIFWGLKELENSWAQHNVRGNLQFLEYTIINYMLMSVLFSVQDFTTTVNLIS